MATDDLLHPDDIKPTQSIPERERSLGKNRNKIIDSGPELNEATGTGLGRSTYEEAEGSTDITEEQPER